MKRIAPIVLLIALISSFWWAFSERRISAYPGDLAGLTALGDRTELRPHIQRLIVSIESGSMLNSQAIEYESDLQKADEVRRVKGKTQYLFYDRPEASEYTAGLVIEVQDKFGQVFHWFAGRHLTDP